LIAAEIARAVKDPLFIARLEQYGADPLGNSEESPPDRCRHRAVGGGHQINRAEILKAAPTTMQTASQYWSSAGRSGDHGARAARRASGGVRGGGAETIAGAATTHAATLEMLEGLGP
jgi:hypothetical protein